MAIMLSSETHYSSFKLQKKLIYPQITDDNKNKANVLTHTVPGWPVPHNHNSNKEKKKRKPFIHYYLLLTPKPMG